MPIQIVSPNNKEEGLKQMRKHMWTEEEMTNPVWFIENFFKCKLWDKQREIATSVKENKITAVRSCHDSGKSFVAARIALWFLETQKDSKVITTAPGWTQVKEILWNEMASAYGSAKEIDPIFNWQGRLLETKIEISPDWFAIGIATKKEGEAGAVADRMLGFHSRTGNILIIVDEGSGVLDPIWGAIEGLMTSENAKLLTIGNPYKLTGGFANFFKQKGVNKIWIQDTDIPNIKENRVIYPGLMSPKYPIEMAEKYGTDSNIYLVKVKGEFPKSEVDTLVSLDDLEKAFIRFTTNEIVAEGEKILGVDVARYGGDRTVLIVRQGLKILRKEITYKQDLMETVGLIKRVMNEEQIKPECINIDEIGAGAGVVDRLREDRLYVNGINVGKTASDPEQYFNIRAEAYWSMREWIKSAAIPKDDDYLELANIKYKFRSTGKGQLQIEAKDEIKKRGLVSPDVADATMLTFARDVGNVGLTFIAGDKEFARGGVIDRSAPGVEKPKGLLPETKDIKSPTEEERKKGEKDADLEIMRKQLNRSPFE